MAKKTIAFLMAAVMLMSTLCFGASAEGIPDESRSNDKAVVTETVSVRIEGVDRTLFCGDIRVRQLEKTTVADIMSLFGMLKYTPTAVIEDGEYGAYVTKIGGDAAADYGENSGWMFMLNGVTPQTGISSLEIEDGDQILFYYADTYGLGMQFPEINTTKLLSEGIVSFTSQDTSYDANWNPTVSVRPVAGMTVTWDGVDYTTDENGQIVVNSFGIGTRHSVQVSRKAENGCPTVLRYAPNTSVKVEFDDVVPGAWYYNAVRDMFDFGLLKSTSDTTFSPNTVMTVGAMVDSIKPMIGTTEIPEELLALIEQYKDEPATREMTALMLKTMSEGMGMEIKPDLEVLKLYSDADKISEPTKDAMAWAIQNKIISGSRLKLNPTGEVTRAEMAQILASYVKMLVVHAEAAQPAA